MVQTLDFFPPVVEDPYTFGKIAAANALSDIYAMGGEVRTALNIVCFPEQMDLNVLGEIMRGGVPETDACPQPGPKGGGTGLTTPARRNCALRSEGQNSHTTSSVRPGTASQARRPVSLSMRMVRNTPEERVGERPGMYQVSVVSAQRDVSMSPVAVHTFSLVMLSPSC